MNDRNGDLNEGPELGQGAPNLYSRNRNQSTNINLDPKWLVKSSSCKFLFHIMVIVGQMIIYKKDLCFIQQVQDGEFAAAHVKENEESIQEIRSYVVNVNEKYGIFVRSYMLLHLVNCVMHGAFVVITFQTPASVPIIYKCHFAQCLIMLTFLLLIMSLHVTFINNAIVKIKSVEVHPYDIATFSNVAIFMICQEFLHVMTLAQFLVEYYRKYKKQLLESQADGDIYDFDPDQVIEYPNYVNWVPAHSQYSRPQEVLDKMIQIKLTKEILLNNLRPKVKNGIGNIQATPKTDMKMLDDDGLPSIILETETIEPHDIHDNSIGREQAPQMVQSTISLKNTDFNYKSHLIDHEEIEDLTCSICMEQMQWGQIIVKTNCGVQQQIMLQSDMNSIFPNNQGNSVLIADEAASVLKGHKFHKDCFRQWLQAGNLDSQEDNNLHNKCPLCRTNLVHQTGGSARNVLSTANRTSNVGPASSAINRGRPGSEAAGRVQQRIQIRSRSIQNLNNRDNFDLYSMGHSFFNGSRQTRNQRLQQNRRQQEMQAMQRNTLYMLDQYQRRQQQQARNNQE